MASEGPYPEISEEIRFPILTPKGRELLHRMRQHPHAPIWNWPNGEQLNEAGLQRVVEFANRLNSASQNMGATLSGWRAETSNANRQKDEMPKRPDAIRDWPDWLPDWVEYCTREVPFYRKWIPLGTNFHEIPTCSRSDLAPKVWEFVPDSVSLEEVIVFSSSGTTGLPTRTPHHPYSAACGVPILEQALRLAGVEAFPRGPEQVAITNLVSYRGAYTTAIVVAYLQEAGCVRVNLDPSAWKSLDHRTKYVEQWDAPVWLGDPVAFANADKLSLKTKPKAIISSIMHLHDGYEKQLMERYGCPIIDLYAMTEAGIIAMKSKLGHRILPHDLYVEVLDEGGNPCGPGVRGEVTITGGRNPFLPLLRYRTGDFASLLVHDGVNYLVGLQGRKPVEYRSACGEPVHSMEVMRVVRRYPIVQYDIQILPSGQNLFRYKGDVDRTALETDLQGLFRGNLGLEEQ